MNVTRGKRLIREIAKQMAANAGDNCGIGSGGFEEGNTCAKGGGGGKFTDPTGYCPPRAKVPKQGFHITDLENLESIAKEGLKAQASTTGGGSSGKIAGVYFVDKLYPKSHEAAPETLHRAQIVLRADTSGANGALDDTEVREITGRKSGIGPDTAFLVGDNVYPDKLEVMSKDGSRKWTPLKQFLQSKEYRNLVSSEKEAHTPKPSTLIKIPMTPAGKKMTEGRITPIGDGWVRLEVEGKNIGGFKESNLGKHSRYVVDKIKEALAVK